MISSFYRRKLPHVRSDGAVYFVTWRLRSGQPDLSDAEHDCVVAAIRHFDPRRYQLHAYVVMNDHVHVLVQRDFGRCGPVWQQEYFDRVGRDDEEYDQKRDYILNNPFKRWPKITGYHWAWAIGMDGSS